MGRGYARCCEPNLFSSPTLFRLSADTYPSSDLRENTEPREETFVRRILAKSVNLAIRSGSDLQSKKYRLKLMRITRSFSAASRTSTPSSTRILRPKKSFKDRKTPGIYMQRTTRAIRSAKQTNKALSKNT